MTLDESNLLFKSSAPGVVKMSAGWLQEEKPGS